jgi:Large extracellular alpha-helical protein
MLSVRGLLLKGSEGKTVVGDSPVEFRIKDEDDTVLYRSTVRTSAFGVAAIEWQIPKNVRLGRYTIEVRDENDEQLNSHWIRVSRYDLPNFIVEAKPAKPFYLPGETDAEVSVHADYLFGKPVTKGKVRVVQEKSREWNWKDQKYDIDEGETREGTLDSTGKFTTHFNIKDEFDDLKDSEWRKYDDIHFAAYLTDLTTNKTEQRRFDIRVSKEPIHVYFMEASDDQPATLPVNAYVSTFYADGTPAQCDVEIKASLDDKDKFKAVGRIKTNALGAGKISMPRPKIGEDDDDLDIQLIARDKNGRKGTVEHDLDFNDDDAIQITTDRAIYKPGDTMNVTVLSTIKDGPVYLDVVNGWTVVDSRSADLKNGRAEIRVPYSGDFKGVLKVAACLDKKNDNGDDELIKASRGVIFPAKQGIAVDASFDKAVYKPNDEATVKFSVLDTVGNALESALGVVVLDKAVEERRGRTTSLAACGATTRAFSATEKTLGR